MITFSSASKVSKTSAPYGPNWIESAAVYCGSRVGDKPDYVELANQLGRRLINEGLTMIYGGGDVGLMGAVKEGAVNAWQEQGIVDTRVIAVNPEFFLKNQGNSGNDVHEETVKDMFVRKSRFLELSDIHIALPGGIGTFDEIGDVIATGDIATHHKVMRYVPQIILIDYEGYYQSLVNFLYETADKGFTSKDRLDKTIHLARDANDAIDIIADLQKQNPILPQDLVAKHNDNNTCHRSVRRAIPLARVPRN